VFERVWTEVSPLLHAGLIRPKEVVEA
jgi:hypothetical protein